MRLPWKYTSANFTMDHGRYFVRCLNGAWSWKFVANDGTTSEVFPAESFDDAELQCIRHFGNGTV